mgnify:CR=1 FL=1
MNRLLGRLLIAGAFAGSAYLTYHGFTKGSKRDASNRDLPTRWYDKSGWIYDDLGWKAPEVPK